MSKTRAKGTSFETEVVKVLQSMGFLDTKRHVLNSPFGDIDGIPMVLECKNHKEMALSEWMNQAAKSGEKAGKLHAVCHKRKGKGVPQAYVTMPLEVYAELLRFYDGELSVDMEIIASDDDV